MKTLKQLERLNKVHKLIKLENTGSPFELSKKLHISEREVYRVIEYLRDIDAEVSFSRNSNTYYYTNDFELYVDVSVKTIVNNQSTIFNSLK